TGGPGLRARDRRCARPGEPWPHRPDDHPPRLGCRGRGPGARAARRSALGRHRLRRRHEHRGDGSRAMTTTATRADGAPRRADARRLLRLARPTLPPLAASFVFRVLTQLCGLGLLGVAAWGVAGVVGGDPDAPSPGRVVALLVALAVGKGVTRYLEQLTGH